MCIISPRHIGQYSVLWVLSRRALERRCNCSSFLWHERQWQPFCSSPPIMAACLLPGWAARMDRMGRGGQNRCSAGNSSFSTGKTLIQSIGPKVTGDLDRKPWWGVKTNHPSSRMKLRTFRKNIWMKNSCTAPPTPALFESGVTARCDTWICSTTGPLTRGHNGCDWRITRCSQPSPQLLFVGRVSHWSFGSCWWGVGSPTGVQTNHGFTDELNQGWVFKPRRASYDVSNRHFRKHSLRDAFLRKRNCRMYSTFSLQVFIGNFVWSWNQ